MKTLFKLLAAAVLCAVASGAMLLATPYPVQQLDAEHSAPLRVLDRHGTVLRSIPRPHGHPGRAAWVGVEQIEPAAVLTLLASEDQRFFEHAGVDPHSVGRALMLNIRSGGANYGASTLTMQLMRMLHSQGAPRTVGNKLRESALALRLERAMGKRDILEQYLNRAYFGRGAYGVEAAARRYFDKPAASLSVGEATFLMVLPRGPSFYDPFRHRERVIERRNHLFELLVAQGKLQPGQARRARQQPLQLRKVPESFEAPHFVEWVLSELPEQVKRRGGDVQTSLDLPLQTRLQQRTREHVQDLSRLGAQQAGVVVLDTHNGDVLAMVGSSDYRQSQLNIITRRRHPGSSLKPFVYAAAIEAGASGASIAYDVADVPSNYRVRMPYPAEHGPARYRQALAGSYNLAAVHVLEEVGVPDVMNRLLKAGIGPLTADPQDYGLRLALGSARVRLLDVAAGYGVFMRGGMAVPARGVHRVQHPGGASWSPTQPAAERVFSPQTAWMVSDMLADAQARRPVFGLDLPVDLPHPVAAKTGTARGFADTVMVMASEQWTVAAWTGRFDGGPTKGLSGMRGAGPLARSALLEVSAGRPWTLPAAPDGIVRAEVCSLSGKRPGPSCDHRTVEHFHTGHVPGDTCDWHRSHNGMVTVQYPRELHGWLRRHGERSGT